MRKLLLLISIAALSCKEHKQTLSKNMPPVTYNALFHLYYLKSDSLLNAPVSSTDEKLSNAALALKYQDTMIMINDSCNKYH